MKDNLLDVESKLRPLFEGGIAYNLILHECQPCMDEADKLEQLIKVLDSQLRKMVTKIIDKAFVPHIPFPSVKDELLSLMGESCSPIFDCLVEIKNQCPPWPWDLFKKVTRESLHPDLLMSTYFQLKVEYNNAKRTNKEFIVSIEKNELLTHLIEVNRLLTCTMVSVANDGLVQSSYQCRIFCHEKNTSRAEAFKIALSLVRGKDPLTLVQHLSLNKKSFNEWERTLVTLSCVVSNKSNSEYLRGHLNNIPTLYQRPYLEPSILNSHREHLEKCRRSLRSFYFSKQPYSDNHHKTDPVTGSTIIKTVMTNYAMLFAFMIIHSKFYIELQQFAKQVKDRMESDYELLIFLNAISDLAQLKSLPHKWAAKLNNEKWAEIVEQEVTPLQSLFNHEIPIQYWGYFILDHIIPSPLKLLNEFVKVRDKSKGKLELLKHDDIKDFELEINKGMAFMVMHLLNPLIQKLLPPRVMLRQVHPFVISDQHRLSLEKKLEIALSLEQGTYNNELFLTIGTTDFETLEKLHMGLAYHYQNSFNKNRKSMNTFLRTLDLCYTKPINDKKFKDGKKIADKVLDKFRASDYSLEM